MFVIFKIPPVWLAPRHQVRHPETSRNTASEWLISCSRKYSLCRHEPSAFCTDTDVIAPQTSEGLPVPARREVRGPSRTLYPCSAQFTADDEKRILITVSH